MAIAAAIVTAATAAGSCAATARAATPTLNAHGSAEQVYVTCLAPDARMSLITPTGAALETQSADSLGGLLFRNVPPGRGYRGDAFEPDPAGRAGCERADRAAAMPELAQRAVPNLRAVPELD